MTKFEKTTPHLTSRFNELVTLGSFSPESFVIILGGDHPSRISEMSPQMKVTYRHEFGHMLHYFTTYTGLKDLSFWAEIIHILENPPEAATPEDKVTKQAEVVLDVSRRKQILSIDDEYYYESNYRLFDDDQLSNRTLWAWRETTGGLFRSDGTLSDHRFWGLRFYVGDTSDYSNSFLRIPLGLRTILEHMATTIDFLSDSFVVRSPQELSALFGEYIDQAFIPDLLHYYALTHRVASEVRRAFSQSQAHWSFLISGQIVAILANIPFDDSNIWNVLKEYAKKNTPENHAQMHHAHPSFVFPLLLHAVFSSGISIDDLLDPHKFQENADSILVKLGLPSFQQLDTHNARLREQLEASLSTSELGLEVAALSRALAEYSNELTPAERLFNPTRRLSGRPFTPIIFGDDYFADGEYLSITNCNRLSSLVDRKNEMLRYHFSRNVVT